MDILFFFFFWFPWRPSFALDRWAEDNALAPDLARAQRSGEKRNSEISRRGSKTIQTTPDIQETKSSHCFSHNYTSYLQTFRKFRNLQKIAFSRFMGQFFGPNFAKCFYPNNAKSKRKSQIGRKIESSLKIARWLKNWVKKIPDWLIFTDLSPWLQNDIQETKSSHCFSHNYTSYFQTFRKFSKFTKNRLFQKFWNIFNLVAQNRII